MTTIVTTMIPGEVTFFDANGVPLNGGSVFFYQQGTSTPKNTWSDFQGTILNANPVVLDSGGRANIWGNGLYRQVVKDSLGNTIWDQNVFAGDISSSLDVLGSTQGDVLYRGASTWTVLTPGTSGQALLTQGASANPIWGIAKGALINIQYFSVAGTSSYTPTSGTNSIIVEVVGGGGGSGGCALTDATHVAAAGGGGGGGYARVRVTSGFSGTTITVGAAGIAATSGNNSGGNGGTSSFGAFSSATGGAGGSGSSAIATSVAGTFAAQGGGRGLGSSGDLTGGGGTGGPGIVFPAASAVQGGPGGSSYFTGGRGTAAISSGTTPALVGVYAGEGGAGGANAASQAAIGGAAGIAGLVIVWEFG